MASTYTTSLKFNKPALGDAGWGSAINGGFTDLVDQALGGQASIDVGSGPGPFVLTIPDGALGDARSMFIRATGTPGGAREIQVPTNRKLYFVTNDSDGAVTVKVSGQTGVVVPVGASVALRINAAGTDVVPAMTHLPDVPTTATAAPGTSTTQIATTAFVQAAMQAMYPVGSIYINATNATNPGPVLGFGTWGAFGAGRVPVGFDAGNPLFDSAEETGGSANAVVVSHTHTYTSTEVAGPAGTSVKYISSGVGFYYDSTISTSPAINFSIDSTGTSGTNANYQPYITVYMWKRTA